MAFVNRANVKEISIFNAVFENELCWPRHPSPQDGVFFSPPICCHSVYGRGTTSCFGGPLSFDVCCKNVSDGLLLAYFTYSDATPKGSLKSRRGCLFCPDLATVDDWMREGDTQWSISRAHWNFLCAGFPQGEGWTAELRFWHRLLLQAYNDFEVVERHKRSSMTAMRSLLVDFGVPFSRSLEGFAVNPFRILDVGSGPQSIFSRTLPNILSKIDHRNIEITSLDPLACHFQYMLAELCGDSRYALSVANAGFLCTNVLSDKPMAGGAENIAQLFRHDSPKFDLIWSWNALDHTQDPLEGLRQMLGVLRNDGTIRITVDELTASNQHGHGLHRWDFALGAFGELLLREYTDHEGTGQWLNVTDALQGQARIKVERVVDMSGFSATDMTSLKIVMRHVCH